MKAQCEKCQAQVELSFAPASGGIDVTCPACQASYFVAATTAGREATATPVPRPAAGEQECPKCGLQQPRADSCRRCGLVFVRWKGAVAEEGVPADAEAERREAALLWSACEASWDEPARHDAFIAYCQRTAQFPYAAGRYRATQAARGAAAEPVATRALERVEKLALTTLKLASRRELVVETKLPYRSAMVLLAVALFLIVGGLFWAVFRQQQRANADDPPDRVMPVVPAAKKP